MPSILCSTDGYVLLVDQTVIFVCVNPLILGGDILVIQNSYVR